MTKLKLEDNINMILNKENDRMSGECTWLRIGLDGGQLWTRLCDLGFRKTCEISLLNEHLLAYQDWLLRGII